MNTMYASSRHNRLRLCVMLAISAAAVCSSGAQQPAPRIRSEVSASDEALIPGSLHPLAQPQSEAGRLPGNTRLTGITLYFKRSAAQQADLEALLAAQQNPASPLYHQWLTPDQFAARFGMAQSDLDAVQTWLEQQGFSIDSIARSRNMIRFSGSAQQVERAFSTEMHYYRVRGEKHFAPSTALSVPAAIAPAIESIRDLSDLRPRPMHVTAPEMKARPAFTSSQTGSVFFAPGDIKTIYDIAPTGYDGSGQTIAVMGESSVVASDVTNFQSAAGLPQKAPNLVVVPATGDPALYSGDESESDLDLEWSAAIAPGANILFIYTGNSPNNNGVFDSLTYAVDQRLGNIISISYGVCEPELGGFSLEAVLQQAAAQGQTVFAASGDDGSTGCFVDPTSNNPSLATQQALAVDYPASSPYVTGVGGTGISQANAAYYTQGQGYWAAQGSSDVITSALKYIPEQAWNDDAQSGQVSFANGGGLSSGGGGVSTLFSKPSWQAGVQGIPADGKRDVPDVALFSSPYSVSYLYCTSDQSAWTSGQTGSCTNGFRDSTSSGFLTTVGGTSAATPVFAGMLALINQQKGYVSGQGLINPTLYTMASNSSTYASAFHDITSGNNFCTAGTTYHYCSSSGATEGYKAGTGYDQVTGLGSVDFGNLAAVWPVNSGTTASLIGTTTSITPATASPNVNASDNFSIAVTSNTGSTAPTGTISVTVDAGTATQYNLASNGTYIDALTFSTAGAHTVSVQYGGDATHASSASSVTVSVQVVSSGAGSFTLSASPATLTVSQSSQGTETITATPSTSPAYTGTVLLSVDFGASGDNALQNLCGGFSSANTQGVGTIQIGGAAAGTTQLLLDTNASDCASALAVSRTGMKPLKVLRTGGASGAAKNGGAGPAAGTVALAGLLLAGCFGRRSRKLRNLAAVAALAAAGLAVSACGGDGSSIATVSNPPKGTYTCTVTGQDSVTKAITSTTTFTFVID